MTLVEAFVPDSHNGCPLQLDQFLCGHGQVIPYGQATETIVFGACGAEPECDVRTINLAGGSLTLEETLSNAICPGACQPNPSEPFSGTLTDVVAGGTGDFSGASGNLSGEVRSAGGVAVIKLSGTITLP
jgi:hypothetical protein